MDLGGAAVSKTGSEFGDEYKDKIIQNGTITLTESSFPAGTYTIGSGAILNRSAGEFAQNDTVTLNIVDGGVFNFTANASFMFPFRYGNGTLVLDNGIITNANKFTSNNRLAINIGYVYNNNDYSKGKDVSMHAVITNGSRMELGLGGLRISGAKSSERKLNKCTTDFAVTNSTIVVTNASIEVGTNVNPSDWLSSPGSSYVNVVFGPGTELYCQQIYTRISTTPSVMFDGATIHWVQGGNSFIGHVPEVGDIYTIDSLGLTVDIPEGKSLTCDSNSSSLKGEGGITKIGEGSITWNQVSSGGSPGMTFTGPLVVSNGTWTSTLDYAATAFAVDGANSTLALSGALTNATVSLSATDGGTLTLAGAEIPNDAAPSLTLAGGGKTDYFTRYGDVRAYTLDSLTLGEDAVLDLDGNATAIDAINATTTNITATSANPVMININFSAAPPADAVFMLFETDSADKFTINPKMGSVTIPHEVSVKNGRLTLTIIADDYTWNNSQQNQQNWGDAGAWTMGGKVATWVDGNNAIFSTANATANLAANAAASEVRFTVNATVSGLATLTAGKVDVADGVLATISAPTVGSLEKTGAGTLMLCKNRNDQTMLSEGTLAMANGATINPALLTLGTDAAKPVVFDYDGQRLEADPTAYLAAGMDVTLTNGEYIAISEIKFADRNFPATLTIAKDATLANKNNRFIFNTDSAKTITINIVGGKFYPAPTNDSNNVWFMNDTGGRMCVNATDGAIIKMKGDLYFGTGHGAEGLSPKMEWNMTNSVMTILGGGAGLFIGNKGSQPVSNMKYYPECPECLFSMSNSVFYTEDRGIILGQNPDENTEKKSGYYKAQFEDSIITSKQCIVYGDRPSSSIYFNGTTLVSNNASDSWIDAVGFADGITPVTVGAKGLVLNTNGKTMKIKANLGGEGAVTKIGEGSLTIMTKQTSTKALNVNVGTVAVDGGVTVARPTTVASGATLTVNATSQTTINTLTLDAGSTLNIASYAGGVMPLSVAALNLPTEGEVALKMDGSDFGVGRYAILEKSGIKTSDVEGKLRPSTGGESYSYSVSGNILVLTVGTPAHGRWIASAGGDFNVPGNWGDNQVPVAGDALDFSGVTGNITINCGDIGETMFGAVTMGTGVITFTGSLTATSFSDTSKIAVGANSTVTLYGDLTFSDSSTYCYLTYKVDEGGAFVVTGTITASESADVRPYYKSSSGYIVAKGLVNSEKDGWNFRLNNDNPAKWVVGKNGFSGGSAGFWSFNNSNAETTIKADADFDIDTWLSTGTSNGKGMSIDTAGWTDPEASYTITVNNCIIGVKPLTVLGGGKFVCNYTPQNANGKNYPYSGAITVTNTATLAINPGKYPTTGAITLNEGTTLEVAQSGTVTLGGDLTLKNGACLGFNYTTRNAPALDLSGKTVTFEEGETTNVVVKITADEGKRPFAGENVLTCGGNFSEDVALTLAEEGAPDWVKRVYVNDAGNIAIDVKPLGTKITVR